MIRRTKQRIVGTEILVTRPTLSKMKAEDDHGASPSALRPQCAIDQGPGSCPLVAELLSVKLVRDCLSTTFGGTLT